MMGCKPHDPKEVTENAGLYVLAAREIFSKLNGRGRNGHRQHPNVSNLSLFVSCFEIYGGKLYDLLNEHMVVKCMEDAKQHVQLLGAYVAAIAVCTDTTRASYCMNQSLLSSLVLISSQPPFSSFVCIPPLSSPPQFSSFLSLHLPPVPPHRSVRARGGGCGRAASHDGESARSTVHRVSTSTFRTRVVYVTCSAHMW
jgi:hypothetical protein